jgi:hypothetical protein
MSDLSLALPVSVAVSDRGAVLVEGGTRTVAMSPYSERAQRLTLFFGPGTHVLATADDVRDLGPATVADLTDALDI